MRYREYTTGEIGLLVFIICIETRSSHTLAGDYIYDVFFRIRARKIKERIVEPRDLKKEMVDVSRIFEETFALTPVLFLLRRNKEASDSEAIAAGKTERQESGGKEDAFDANGK